MKLKFQNEIRMMVACGFAMGCLMLGLDPGAVAALLAVLLK